MNADKIKKELILAWCEEQIMFGDTFVIENEIKTTKKLINKAHVKYGDDILKFLKSVSSENYTYRLLEEAMYHDFDIDDVKTLYDIYPVVEIFDDKDFIIRGSASIFLFATKALEIAIDDEMDEEYIEGLKEIISDHSSTGIYFDIMHKSLNVSLPSPTYELNKQFKKKLDSYMTCVAKEDDILVRIYDHTNIRLDILTYQQFVLFAKIMTKYHVSDINKLKHSHLAILRLSHAKGLDNTVFGMVNVSWDNMDSKISSCDVPRGSSEQHIKSIYLNKLSKITKTKAKIKDIDKAVSELEKDYPYAVIDNTIYYYNTQYQDTSWCFQSHSDIDDYISDCDDELK